MDVPRPPDINDTADRSCQPTLASRIGALAAGFAAILAIAGCGSAVAADPQDLAGTRTTSGVMTYTYSRTQVSYRVPAGVTSVTISATGGRGGTVHASGSPASGAQVSGTVAVQTGQQLLVQVGGNGGSAGTSDHDPQGGWNGLGADGGNGNAASDYLRTSGAGGGATTIQLTDVNGNNPQTILVAGGGGGNGGGSGDPDGAGYGGSAGCTDSGGSPTQQPSWVGSNGTHASGVWGGGGGTAGGQPGMAGGRGFGGSGLGGNGGGGGGGLLGGSGGGGTKGTSPGGGGGAGSSGVFNMTDISVTCGSGSGQVTITPGS